MGRASADRLQGRAAGRSPVRVSPHAGLRAGDAGRVRRGPGAGAAGRSLAADANRAGGRSEVKERTVWTTREKRATGSREGGGGGPRARPAQPAPRLRYYATVFPTVEIDATYYALLDPEIADRWVEWTPQGFVFQVKAFGLFTGHGVDPRRLAQEGRR